MTRTTNQLPVPRPGGPLIADNWKLIQSVLSGSDRHLLPKPKIAPFVQAENNVNGNLTLSGCKYKVSYCAIDPESQNVIVEGEPSDASIGVNVQSGRVFVYLPNRVDNKIINGYRIYRLTSFRTVLFPSLVYAIQSTTDDCVNSTYQSSGTSALSPSQIVDITKATTTSGTRYLYSTFTQLASGTGQELSQQMIYDGNTNNQIALIGGGVIVLRTVGLFNLDSIKSGGIGTLSISSVTLTGQSQSYQCTNTIDLWAYNNDPSVSSIDISSFTTGHGYTDSTIYNAASGATGNRKYISTSTAYQTPNTTATVTLGNTSTSQACIDVAQAKAQGKLFALSNIGGNEASYTLNGSTATSRTFISNAKLNVAYTSNPINFSITDNRIFFGDRTDCGLRFQNVQIPTGATIKSASITFTAWPDALNNTTGVRALIYGQSGASNPATFSTQGDFTGRTKTTASVNWAINSAWTPESKYTTPDLSGVMQEIVSNAGWAQGNNMGFIIDNSTSARDSMRLMYSFKSSSAKAPVLNVTYTTSNAVGTMYRLVDTVSCEGSRVYMDNIPDSVLNNNIDLSQNSSTDLEVSNYQTIRALGTPLHGDLARIAVTLKSSYKVPSDKVLFVTHLSGSGGPFTLGSTSPITFNVWSSDDNKSTATLLLPTALAFGPDTTLSITSGSGTANMMGYFVNKSDSFEVIWRGNPVIWTIQMDTKAAILGQFYTGGSVVNISRDGTSYALPYYTKASAPNDALNGGQYGTGYSQPILLKEGDIVFASGSASPGYVCMVKFNGL